MLVNDDTSTYRELAQKVNREGNGAITAVLAAPVLCPHETHVEYGLVSLEGMRELFEGRSRVRLSER